MSRVLLTVLGLLFASPARAQAPISYTLSFPEPEHRWLQVEAVFSGIGSGPLQLQMSRSSPGRYALHEFAKNVYDVAVVDGAGHAVQVSRPNPHEWDVTGHDGTVRVAYKVYGDRVDGTYLGIDSTHAHINMPATLMWARGLDERPVQVRFEPPPGAEWCAATQLHPGADAMTFTAPNLQYLMDSPVELGHFVTRTFRAGPLSNAGTGAHAVFHIALHHDGTGADADRLTADVQKIARAEGAIFGEFPAYDVGSYTILLDLLPYAAGDGMEHRNSTVITFPGALRNPAERRFILSAIAHEMFHGWNVERIRPKSIEPFNFEDANMSGELWLAEGFTNYFEPLVQARTGLVDLSDTATAFAAVINEVTLGPGRLVRTAEDMSRLAPLVDAARSVDRTDWDNTFISYYTWGEAIGLGLDLTLRDRTGGRVTLDDVMRAMWVKYGKAGGRREGYVDNPYTLADARDTLAEVSGDRNFADDFFARYIQGHEAVDYRRLLECAGLILRPAKPARASIGRLRIEFSPDGRVAAPVPVGSPAYKAGLEQDDRLLSLDGEEISSLERLNAVLDRCKPGTTVIVRFLRRGATVSRPLTLEPDPQQEIVPLESTGATLPPAQQQFREAWLGSAPGTKH